MFQIKFDTIVKLDETPHLFSISHSILFSRKKLYDKFLTFSFILAIDLYRRRMGGEKSSICVSSQLQNRAKKSRPGRDQKPGSKTTFMYIKPVELGDDYQSDPDDEFINSQKSKELNKQEYELMEADDGDSGEIEEIKVKWNNFIKMKTRNYLDDYQILRQIGRGGFGKVNKVQSKYTGLMRAAKKIKKSTLAKQQMEKLFAQMAIMQSLDHVNIVKLYEVYDYKSHYVLILQLCEGGELFKKIVTTKNLPQSFVAGIIKQILKVLLYLNHMGVVHRDLKPENMIFENDSSLLKIIDFGIAHQRIKNQKLTQRVGTPYYVAPEVLLKKYDEKCDVWSTGVIMYMMLTHRPPFRGNTEVRVMQSILSQQPDYKGDFKTPCSKECLDLLQKLLKKNPNERISAEQAYHHPWLQKTRQYPTPQKQKQIIDNISSFKFKNKLEAVVYTFVVSQLLTSQQKNQFMDIFQDLDTNCDGVISSQEFQKALKQKSKIPEEKISILLRLIDTNSSGEIDLTQFIVAGLKMKDVLNQSHFEQAFAYFDIDHSGMISYEEIAFFLDDPSNSQEIIKNIFLEVDENSDGAISKQEFVKLLMKQAHKKKISSKL